MVDIRAIQNLGYEHPDTGFPDRVKDAVDRQVVKGISKLWRGVVQVAASGFGKGVLITAALVLAAGMMIGGADAIISGALVEAGVKEGIGRAFGFLLSGGGIITLLAGGALGSVADTQKYQDRITADMAKLEARQLEKARDGEIEKPVSVQPEREKTVQNKFQQPGNGRAAKSVANAFATGDITLESNGFAQREAEQRIARAIAAKAR